MQKRIFEDWSVEIDCWFRMVGQWPLSEASGEMIEMLSTSDKTNDRDAMDLIYRRWSNQKVESYKEAVNRDLFVVICKKFLFGVREVHFAQSDGIVLTDMRRQIMDLDTLAPGELGTFTGLLKVYGSGC